MHAIGGEFRIEKTTFLQNRIKIDVIDMPVLAQTLQSLVEFIYPHLNGTITAGWDRKHMELTGSHPDLLDQRAYIGQIPIQASTLESIIGTYEQNHFPGFAARDIINALQQIFGCFAADPTIADAAIVEQFRGFEIFDVAITKKNDVVVAYRHAIEDADRVIAQDEYGDQDGGGKNGCSGDEPADRTDPPVRHSGWFIPRS